MAGIGFWMVQSTRSLNQIQTNSRLLENCTTNCDEGIHEVQKLKKRAIINCLVNSLFDIDSDIRGALFWWKTAHQILAIIFPIPQYVILDPERKKRSEKPEKIEILGRKKNDDDIFDRMLELVVLSFILGVWVTQP